MGAADDEKAKQLVLAVLKDSSVQKINFTLGKVNVDASDYARVAEAIRSGKITVLYEASLTQGSKIQAHYVRKLALSTGLEMYDVILVGFTDLGKTTADEFVRQKLIVHECTHAMFDMLKTSMIELENEAAAYVAGAMFGLAKLATMGRATKKNPNGRLEGAAWDLARHLEPGLIRGVNWWIQLMPKWFALLSAIADDPNYGPKVGKTSDNDGVGRPWKLPPPQPATR